MDSGSAVEYNDCLYAVSGTYGGSPATNVYRYDGMDWTAVNGLPDGRRNLGSVVFSNRLYAVGGHDGSSGKTNVWYYDGTNWTETVGLPQADYEMGTAVYNNRIYCIGGGGGGGEKTNVWRFDGSTWEAAPALPQPRTALSAAVLNGKLYALGGYNSSSKTNVWAFDGSSWTEVAGYPSVCSAMASAVREGLIYSVGGAHQTNVWTFDGTNWSDVAGIPEMRYAPAGATFNRRVYSVGGYYLGSSSGTTNVFVYPNYTEGVVPVLGQVAGCTTVTISGVNLCNGSDVTNVTLRGVSAASIDSQSATQIVVTTSAGIPGLGDVAVYSTSYGATTKSNAFTYTGPTMSVLGTNGDIIADGESANADKGTDFGSIIWGTGLTNIFSITNAGNETLTISVITTNGAGAASFIITGLPVNVGAGSVSNFSMVFAPTSAGTHTAAVTVVNSSTTTPYRIYLAGTGLKQDQTIGFPAIANQEMTNVVGLAATASSGLEVSFGIGSGPGSINGGTNLSFTATGTVSIVASQSGNTNWNAAPDKTNTFNVTGGEQPLPQTGTLSIDVTPDIGMWTMCGPTNYSGVTTGTGDLAETNVLIGTYTVEYGAFTGFRTPSAQTNEVTSGASVVFTGVYEKNETPGDFTGDGKTDLAVYDEATGCWYIRSEDGTIILWQTPWGGLGFTSVQGDYDGDGIADMAVYYAGYWYIRTVAGALILWAEQWGGPDFTPVTGDYNGDGCSDLTVYHEGTGFWYSRTVSGTLLLWQALLGGPGYTPVPGDYDGDSQSDVGVYCNGYWFVKTVDEMDILRGTMPWGGTFGGPDFTPVASDYDGDGITDLAVYYEQSGSWFITTLTGSVLVWGEQWGGPGFTPVPGDYNGDGISDLAVYYGGYWFVETVDGTLIMYAENWGAQGYEPIGK